MRATFDPPTDTAAYRFCHRLRARFSETDAMGVIHHAAYFPYLESARTEFLRSVGHPYDELSRDGIELPVVEVVARYLRPLRFDDEVGVWMVIARATGALMEVGYLLTVDGEARSTAVTVHGVTLKGRPTRCPAWLRGLAGGGGTAR